MLFIQTVEQWGYFMVSVLCYSWYLMVTRVAGLCVRVWARSQGCGYFRVQKSTHAFISIKHNINHTVN